MGTVNRGLVRVLFELVESLGKSALVAVRPCHNMVQGGTSGLSTLGNDYLAIPIAPLLLVMQVAALFYRQDGVRG